MFAEKLDIAIANHQSLLCVGLDPNPDWFPYHHETSSDGLQSLYNWLINVIDQTADSVCAFKPTLGFYLALGSPGLQLLEAVLAHIPNSIPVILDAKHADLNTASAIARTVFEKWRVDAITLNLASGQDGVAPFLLYPDKGVFLLCRHRDIISSSEEADLTLSDMAEIRAWGTPDQLGFEMIAPSPDLLGKIRSFAPERLLLLRRLWTSNYSLSSILTAGINQDGSGLLIPIPQDYLADPDRSQKIRLLRDHVNQIRFQVIAQQTCALWVADVCLLSRDPRLELILQLYDIGCILFGEYVQASGAVFPYYIDLRTIISNPQVFQQILRLYEQILKTLTFDRIAGIPYGSLPTATGLALRMNRPMIFPRKEVKAHGTRRLIEGAFEPDETVVVVDDILISGKSAMEGAAKLQSAGLRVNDIVVLIDHEQGVSERLAAAGYRGHAVFRISEITETLLGAGRLTAEERQALTVHWR
ncbi:MAG: bifunctional orotidine-5'-phosphate decarboxylase/orotate phosphoribosyltransferase [Cyanobacteriota bacterium]|nr:bifunctional orotidine-5'-phosphate decarboxylase/orotate phosphoribosyltransferase [Cyanobacteriota bacterium]